MIPHLVATVRGETERLEIVRQTYLLLMRHVATIGGNARLHQIQNGPRSVSYHRPRAYTRTPDIEGVRL
jgi:hypothetical protein